jgi:hypothetical protein
MQSLTSNEEEEDEAGTEVTNTLERVKHFLWHSNVDVTLECLDSVLFELDLQRNRSTCAANEHAGCV